MKGIRLSTTYRGVVYGAKDDYVKLCSCILKDGRIAMCFPRNKIKRASWKRANVRHTAIKRQMFFKNYDDLLYYVNDLAFAALKIEEEIKRRKKDARRRRR